jgi:lipopolysaccharide heptosyltransferase III
MNILITRLQNIGDMLVFVPALRLLREVMPDARITLLCKHSGGVEIIKNCPYYDDMITVQNRSLKEKIRLITEFRKRKLDCFIISPQDLGRCPWGFMGGAKKIIGFPLVLYRGKWKSEKLPFLLHCKPQWDTEASETENCVDLVTAALSCLGAEVDSAPSLKTEYSWFAPETPEKVLEKTPLSSPYIVVAPFSKQNNKNWSFEKLTDFLQQLHGKTGYGVVLTGGPAEAEKCLKLAEVVGENSVSLAGQLSLDESAWLINQAELFFGPDSGPAHLATAVKTPAVVLYGPADYKRWRTADPAAPRIDLLGPQSDVNNISIAEALNACVKLTSL